MRGCQGVIPHVGVHGGAVEERTTGVPRTDETGLGGGGRYVSRAILTVYSPGVHTGGGGGGEGGVKDLGYPPPPPQIYFPPQEF